MIIKGKSRGNGAQLGVYLITPGDNERVEVLEIRGVAATDVPGAILEMEAHAAGTRCEKPLYHASVNARANEPLTHEQAMISIDRLEAKLEFTDQPRVIVLHEKAGRVQYHIVWDRIDLERMRAIPDSWNFAKHEEIARELEREFGHERVQGAHAERDGRPRPKRTPSYSDMEQSKRTGLGPQQVTDEVTALWRSTDSGKAFAAALAEAGYVLARGDRRDFVIIDSKGGVHSLARRIEGARVSDVRARMADLDARELPSVAQAKAIQRGREIERGEGVSYKPSPAATGISGAKAPEADRGRSQGGHENPGLEAGPGRAVGGILDGIAKIVERVVTGDKEADPMPPLDSKSPEPQIDPSVLADEAQKTQRRQELLREFGRPLLDEREAEVERQAERERRRSR